jgi:hypothetical protein
VRFSSHPIQKIIFEDLNYSGHEHLIASKQLGKYSGGHILDEVHKNSKMTPEVLESLHYSAMKSSGAC